MRVAVVIALAAVLVFFSAQVWYLYRRGSHAESGRAELDREFTSVTAERDALQADRDYYGNPANLEKELRARFNYRAADETMVVIVPGNPSATTPTSSSP